MCTRWKTTTAPKSDTQEEKKTKNIQDNTHTHFTKEIYSRAEVSARERECSLDNCKLNKIEQPYSRKRCIQKYL